MVAKCFPELSQKLPLPVDELLAKQERCCKLIGPYNVIMVLLNYSALNRKLTINISEALSNCNYITLKSHILLTVFVHVVICLYTMLT